MNLNKFTFLFYFFLGTTLFVACDKDEDCTAPDLSQNIIGTWSYLSGPEGTFEFQSDGTLNDPDGNIFEIEINGQTYDDKSYVVIGDTLRLTAMETNGSGTSQTACEYPP
jgi:hypothetical protein